MAECTCADPTMVVRALNSGEMGNSITKQSEKNTKTIDETLYGEIYESDEGKAKGKHGAFGPIRFCRWAAPEVTGAGDTWFSTATKAATLAIGIINATYQQKIQDLQQDLADGYYRQAKYKWDRFNDVYRPLEQKLLDETSTKPIRTLDCAGAKSRARTAVTAAFNPALNWYTRTARAMRLCVDDSALQLFAYRRAVVDIDTENYNLSDDQWYTDYKNDQRWNRRSSVLNIGRNMSSEALSYGQVANAMLSQVSSQLDKVASTLSTSLGYFGTRFDTMTPNTYLGGSNSGLVQMGATSPGGYVQGGGVVEVPGSGGYGNSSWGGEPTNLP